MNIIRRLLGLCEHQWEVLSKEQVDIHIGYPYDDTTFLYVQTKYILRCSKCGNLKSKKF